MDTFFVVFLFFQLSSASPPHVREIKICLIVSVGMTERTSAKIVPDSFVSINLFFFVISPPRLHSSFLNFLASITVHSPRWRTLTV